MSEQPKARPTRTTLAARAAWLPAEWEPADVSAVQALARGDATEEQQKRALDWIINSACGTYEVSYRPGGQEGERDTCFAEGRRFVGSQIVKALKISLYALRNRENA
jgi:hypothetical protein